MTPMDRFTKCVSERCYGVEVADGQTLVVAEVVNGEAAVWARYAADESGIQALTRHVANDAAHPRICIRACGAVALAVAFALTAVPRGEVLMLADHGMQFRAESKSGTLPTPEARAERLAFLAQRML